MVTTAATSSQTAVRRRRSTAARAGRRPDVHHRERFEPTPDHHRPRDLESLSADWQRALDAAGSALRAAGDSLPASELRERRMALVHETERTALALRLQPRSSREPTPWLSPAPVTKAMLGLPTTVRACIFDVEKVLTDSSFLHAWAWGEVFDDFLSRLGETTGRHFDPFDRVGDYRAYVEGRARLDGVHAFLRSRGIQVREGRSDEAGDAETAHGLARRKGKLLEWRLQEHGVTALPGARRYLEAARRAGVLRAVVYESASTLPMLEQAGLASLLDTRIDAAVMNEEGLRSRPLPDLLLTACTRLDVPTAHTVTFTGSPAGVVAGRRAGMLTVAVGDAVQRESLEGFGADRVTPSLRALLDQRLTTAVEGKQ